MKRNRLRLAAIAAIATAFFHANGAAAQEAKPAPELAVKVYRVDDLVLPSSDYPFRGTSLPGMAGGDRASGRGMAMGMMGGGMGMMGGGMMGGGGEGGQDGAPSGRPKSAAHERGGQGLTIERLEGAIKSLIEPESWDDVGGPGTIMPLGGSLAVRHTAKAQEEIAQLLQDLRQEVGAIRTVTVQAHWIALGSPQLDNLLGDGNRAEGNKIDRRALRELAEGSAPSERYRSQITCFNGQTVHIVSGRLRNVVQGGMPVVGGSGVGYQPLTSTPHIGAMLQVTPSLLPSGDAAVVDLQSTVTRWDLTAAEEASPVVTEAARDDDDGDDSDEKAQGDQKRGRPRGAMRGMGGMPGMSPRGASGAMGPGMMGGGAMGGGPRGGMMMGGGMGAMMQGRPSKKERDETPVPIDRVNIVAQQLATSLRVPLGVPVLVGGMTFPDADDRGDADEQLYLILEVTVDQAESPSSAPSHEGAKKPAKR